MSGVRCQVAGGRWQPIQEQTASTVNSFRGDVACLTRAGSLPAACCDLPAVSQSLPETAASWVAFKSRVSAGLGGRFSSRTL